jgi:nicotinamide-nucleotide amidase
VEEEMDRIFGTAIWGRDEDTMEGYIADQMHERRTTLAVMESCTGGLMASTLTDVPGASGYFLGSYVTYATQQKIDLGVPASVIQEFGVVSQETAKAMAQAARERAGADYGIGITSRPEPDGPPGTVHVAVATGRRLPTPEHDEQGRQAVAPRSDHVAVAAAAALLGEAR